MARRTEDEDLDDQDMMVEEEAGAEGAEGAEGEGEGEPEGEQPFLYAVTSQTPWWIVSVLLHGLAFALMSLISAAIVLPPSPEPVVMVTELAAKAETQQEKKKDDPNDKRQVLMSQHDTPPTDPKSTEASDVVVPPDVLAKAELGDHFETINLDRPDTQSAFGNEDAKMFHNPKEKADDAAGGGGVGGTTLDDMIGSTGGGSPGTGGGWGGGHGTGIGVNDGAGKGSFGNRGGGGRRLMVKRHGGSKATENGVDSALRWLAYHQEPDGHWDAMKYQSGQKTDTAVTGLALLAFLGAGHTEKVGEWKDNVRRAVAWLKSKQAADGGIYDTTDAGGHRGGGYPIAIATLAMAEAAGMANIPDTRNAAQKAIDYCTEIHQQGDGSDKLGWRYAKKSEGDTSVTGWFIMALKSAKVAGLKVNHAAFDGAIKYLDSVQHPVDGAAKAADSYGPTVCYWYMVANPHEHTQHRLTAIGNLARQFLGWKKEDLQSSVEWFVTKGNVPTWGANGDSVDLYYWYYGTLCVFQQGGDIWKRWNDAMIKALVENQAKNGDDAGSWNPVGAYSSEWGRVGQTALGALCLEVYYRYQQLKN